MTEQSKPRVENASQLQARIDSIERSVRELQARLDEMQSGNLRDAVTYSDLEVLGYVKKHGRPKNGVTMKQIRDATKLSLGTISTALSNLQARKTIRRRPAREEGSRYRYVVSGSIPPELEEMLKDMDRG